MAEPLRYIAGSMISLLVGWAVQALFDRSRRLRFRKHLAELGFRRPSGEDLPPLERWSFLGTLGGDAVEIEEEWGGSIGGEPCVLLAARSPFFAPRRFTVLAVRRPEWLPAAGFAARSLRRGATRLEESEDPRLRVHLEEVGVAALVARDPRLWLRLEGPWRLLGRAAPPSREGLRRLFACSREILPMIAEPHDLSGGMEWSVRG